MSELAAYNKIMMRTYVYSKLKRYPQKSVIRTNEVLGRYVSLIFDGIRTICLFCVCCTIRLSLSAAADKRSQIESSCVRTSGRSSLVRLQIRDSVFILVL